MYEPIRTKSVHSTMASHPDSETSSNDHWSLLVAGVRASVTFEKLAVLSSVSDSTVPSCFTAAAHPSPSRPMRTMWSCSAFCCRMAATEASRSRRFWLIRVTNKTSSTAIRTKQIRLP